MYPTSAAIHKRTCNYFREAMHTKYISDIGPYRSRRYGDYEEDVRSSSEIGHGADVVQHHLPTRPVDRDKAEAELTLNIKKATSPEETAPKQKHVRSASPCDHGDERWMLMDLKNASSIPGITTRQILSGLASRSNQSSLMRFRHSRRLSRCTRFFKKAILLYVVDKRRCSACSLVYRH